MDDPQEARRLAVLLQWAADVHERGLPIPVWVDLDVIARTGAIPPDASLEVAAWRPTIEWMLKQLRFGALEPQAQIPRELENPTNVPAPPVVETRGAAAPTTPPALSDISDAAVPDTAVTDLAAAPTGDSTLLTALKGWRNAAVDHGEPAIQQLKETHLRLVANSRWRTEDEIRAAFAPIVGKFANQLASVMSSLSSAGPERTPASTPAGSAPERATPASTTPAATPSTETRSVLGWSGSVPTASTTVGSLPVTHPAPDSVAPRRASTVEEVPAVRETVDLNWDGFVPFDYSPAAMVPTALRLNHMPDASVRIGWETGDVQCVYRLVSADNNAPYSPDQGQRVAATTALLATDTRTFRHAVRHFQVWRNDGDTLDEARNNQPALHAFGATVSPVLDLDIHEEEGRIIGTWHVLEGTQRVQVFRVPIHSAAGSSGDPSFRILSEADNLNGFVDTHATRGDTYLYQVFAEAQIHDIAQLSPATVREMSVSIVHEPVLDLSFTLHDDLEFPMFDLAWTAPPGGRVIVYRTNAAPVAGIERSVQHESVLEQAGLGLERQLAHPISVSEGRAFMTDVPWPRKWTRAYFTAVVFQDGQAFVGNTERGVRVPPVKRPKITERVNRQILTFEWPDGADVVQVYKSLTGLEAALAIQGPAVEVSATDYREKGGLSFSDGSLGSDGCDLHLVSVAFDGGRRVQANPVTVTYPALLRLQYTVTIKRTMTRRQHAIVTITADRVLAAPPPFVLVHNANRLPLSVTDGTALAVELDSDQPGPPTRRFVPTGLSTTPGLSGWRTNQESWARDVAKPSGFIRLFVDLPPEHLQHIALLDPPVSTLRVQGLLEQAQGVFGG